MILNVMIFNVENANFNGKEIRIIIYSIFKNWEINFTFILILKNAQDVKLSLKKMEGVIIWIAKNANIVIAGFA